LTPSLGFDAETSDAAREFERQICDHATQADVLLTKLMQLTQVLDAHRRGLRRAA
jgi:hypothetical protein